MMRPLMAVWITSFWGCWGYKFGYVTPNDREANRRGGGECCV